MPEKSFRIPECINSVPTCSGCCQVPAIDIHVVGSPHVRGDGQLLWKVHPMFRLQMVVFITSLRVVITLTYEFQISTSWRGGPSTWLTVYFCGGPLNVPDANDCFIISSRAIITFTSEFRPVDVNGGIFLISSDLCAELTFFI